MIALSGVRSSCDMLARNSLLSRVARWSSTFLAGERALVPAALLEHRGAVEADDDLVAEGLEQLEIVLAERPAVPPVVDADGADDDAGRAERDDGRGAEATREPGHLVAPGVGVHVVGEQRRVVRRRPSRPANRPPGRACRRWSAQRPASRRRPGGSGPPRPRASRAALRLEQVGRRAGRPPRSETAACRCRRAAWRRGGGAARARGCGHGGGVERLPELRAPAAADRFAAADRRQASTVATSGSATPSQWCERRTRSPIQPTTTASGGAAASGPGRPRSLRGDPPGAARGTRSRRWRACAGGRAGRDRSPRRSRCAASARRAPTRPRARAAAGSRTAAPAEAQRDQDGRHDGAMGWWGGRPARSPWPGRAAGWRAGWCRRRPRAGGCARRLG